MKGHPRLSPMLTDGFTDDTVLYWSIRGMMGPRSKAHVALDDDVMTKKHYCRLVRGIRCSLAGSPQRVSEAEL